MVDATSFFSSFQIQSNDDDIINEQDSEQQFYVLVTLTYIRTGQLLKSLKTWSFAIFIFDFCSLFYFN